MKNRRGSKRSASPNAALASVPATKPSATALVASAPQLAVRPNSLANIGSTAAEENHTLNAMTLQATNSESDRHLVMAFSRLSAELNWDEVSAGMDGDLSSRAVTAISK